MFHYIAVIGAGTMGSGIAQVSAISGVRVIVVDAISEQLDKAKKAIEISLAKFLEKGVISKDQCALALHNLTFTTRIEEIADAEAVIEAIVEKEQLKVEILRKVEQLCKPFVFIGSNTSSISINKLAMSLKRPERFMGVHFFNPVPLMKLVELVRGERTSQETFDKFKEFALHLHKDPAEVNDAPGFISNRILMPMINEAILALEQKVADRESIDKVMVLGMNHPMGPLKLADFIGLDVCLDIMNVLFAGFKDAKYKPAKLLEEKVRKKELGKKTGRGFYEYSSK